MVKERDYPAFPIQDSGTVSVSFGLSKLEYTAIQIAAAQTGNTSVEMAYRRANDLWDLIERKK